MNLTSGFTTIRSAWPPRLIVLCLTLLIIGETSSARTPDFHTEIPITGTVSDALMNPISGASVTVKNQAGVTTTDSLGHFRIMVANGNESLVITYVGYAPLEIAINTSGCVEVLGNRSM